MAKFLKLKKNPLGLGSVVITDSEFNDDDFTDDAKIKLSHAINAGLVKVIDGKFKAPVQEETKTVEVTDDNTLVALREDNVKVNKELEIQVTLNEESKQLVEDTLSKVDEMVEIVNTLKDMVGYTTMSVEELAEEFTVEELTFIANKLHGLEIKSGTKEATIAKKIVEVVGK